MALGVLVSLCRVTCSLFICMYISGQYYKQVWPFGSTCPTMEWQGSVFVFVVHAHYVLLEEPLFPLQLAS